MTSDASIRRRALDPARSFIVQAPAGSGKTELLTQRYLRLLAGVGQPEQILAITFTRKAAAEMRNRILVAIEGAAGPAPEAQHKRTTWELACAVRAADVDRGWRLALHPSRLRIQTIDSLNSTLARRLPVLSGTGSALEPADDPDPLYEAAAERLIERLGDGSRESAALEALVVHLGNRVDRLIELLCDLLKQRDQWLHQIVSAAAHDDLRGLLERTLARVIDRHLEELCAGLAEDRRRELWELTTYAAANLLRNPDLSEARRRVLAACPNQDAVPGAHSGCLHAWLAVAEVFVRNNGQLYKIVTKRQGFPSIDAAIKARMQDVLAQLAEEEGVCAQLAALRELPHPVYSEEQWLILQALLDVLPLAVAELQIVFQSQGRADYVESALRALQALGTSDEPTDLALAFDYRLQHLLVDEFQDTSFAQLDLLERLTAGWVEGDGRTMFCVGDPMQSIYRFRQAEVGLFLQLQREGLRNVRLEPLQLTANFRSTRPIVEWVNRVFPAVLSPHDDPEQGAVKYSASTAASGSRAGGVHVHPALGNDELIEARRVTAIVREALKRNAEGTIAVLVTARAHVGMIASELNAASIGFQAIEIEQLAERSIVQDLIALTRALVHLADRTAWLAVLRAPWCGLSLTDLHALVDGDRSSTVNELLAAANTAGRELTPEGRARIARTFPILRAALNERGRWPLRDWVERAWNALAGPATLRRTQDLDDAEAFFRRLDEIEIAGDLEDAAQLERKLERLFARPRTEGRARVEVMTIHKAKGLEFDTVILPALHRWARGDDRRLLHWTRVAGRGGGIVFAPVKADGREPDPMYRWIELLERERSARERGRLLYVAATRAKRDLHLLGAVQAKDEAEGVRLLEPRNGSMLRMLWHELTGAFEAFARAPQPGVLHLGNMPFSLRLRRLPLNWQAPQADEPLQSRTIAVTDIDARQPDFDWVTETSRHVGTLVHRELERLVRAGAATVEGALSAVARPAARARLSAELAELGVPPDRCEAAAARVVAAIEHTLADERGRWLLGLTGEIHDAESELALSGALDGRIVQSIIDRSFVDAQGVRWVVDFKTSTHEGGGLEAFLAAEAERYRGQLLHYVRLMRAFRPAQPVRAALYFPLMRQWREVEVEASG